MTLSQMRMWHRFGTLQENLKLIKYRWNSMIKDITPLKMSMHDMTNVLM